MEAPIVVKPIPDQVVNEQASFGPFNLNDFIKAPEGSTKLTFSAGLKNGGALPKGMILTSDGILTGIPGRDTQGIYEIVVTARNGSGSIDAALTLTIKPSLSTSETEYVDQLKAQVWQAIDQRAPIPELAQLLGRKITALDIYYLLERWGILKIWDAFNLDPPGEKHLLKLEGASKHYDVYDRGSCIIAVPKDLFSHERTTADGIQTAQAMAREVYKRNWTVELVGFDKFTRAAWIEIKHLGDLNGKQLEIINYSPSYQDLQLYTNQAKNKMNMSME